jgi:lipopolysaccharide/colanic/teichoic acid biosynthesis glycosyltransferase
MKRLLDVVLAGSALIVLSPIVAAIAIAIRIRMGSPVLFRQVRPGLHGRPFELVKFRSMHTEVDAHGRELPMEERVTRLGAFIRRTSLDELPELWNILKGEMSIVGPRPLLVEYLPRYSATQARRHEVRPGLTGLAQVNGRHELDWDQRFALDVWYVDHWDLRVDLRIMLVTAGSMLHGEATPETTRENYAFMGSEEAGPPGGPWPDS